MFLLYSIIILYVNLIKLVAGAQRGVHVDGRITSGETDDFVVFIGRCYRWSAVFIGARVTCVRRRS